MIVTFATVGFESLGISQLSAILKREGHEVHLAFSVSLFHDRDHLHLPYLARIFDDRQRVIDKIKETQPDVLAFSVLTATYQWALSIAREAKILFPELKVIFGGVHASALPERVIEQPEVDIVVIGEADIAFPRICAALEDGGLTGQEISNTLYKLPDGSRVRGPQDGFVTDLDSLPHFDKAIWEEYVPQHDSYLTMASRGCPYRCTFCFNSFFANLPGDKKTGYIRQRSVDHVMEELRVVKARYRPRLIRFYDDVFIINKPWLKEFCERYGEEIGLPFQVEIHANYMSEDIARMLADAGCVQVDLGVQSANESFKRRVVKRSEKNDKVADSIAWLKKYHIHVRAHHLFGLPGEPLESQEMARQLFLRSTPGMIDTYFVMFYPGTEIVGQALASGRITEADVEKMNDGLELTVFLKPNRTIEPAHLPVYRGYQVVLKLMPQVPAWMRPHLDPKFFSKAPPFVSNFALFCADIVFSLGRLSVSHILYAKYNLYHIWRHICERMGWPVRGATRIRIDRQFPPTVAPPKALGLNRQ